MDDHYSPRPVAGWFIIAAGASLLFMGLGCVSYLMHVLANPATMPLDQRAAYEAEPAWVTGAYAVAVWIGLLGALLLVMRRRAAEWALLISLIAVLVWLAGLVLVTPLRESMSANDLIVAIIVSALTWTIYWFARHSRQRGWLR
jgi:ascorbate-specific PTS system EIIC-type component UlaA